MESLSFFSLKSKKKNISSIFIQIKIVGIWKFCLFNDDSSCLGDEVQVLSHSGETSWVSDLAT